MSMQTDRTKLRIERLRQLEREQLQWDQDALIMPEDLDRALVLSFESVKTEFSDLDGLSWSRYSSLTTPKLSGTDAPRPPTFPRHSRPAPTPAPAPRPASQDTIRPSRPPHPPNQLFPHTAYGRS